MELTGEQIEELSAALLGAFDGTSLKRMLRMRLDKNLEAITPSGSLNHVVFELISVAEREGWIYDLVREAHEFVPGNQLLAAFFDSLSPPGAPTPPLDSGVPPAAGPALHIDPEDPPIAEIRRLLTSAFTDKELRIFCDDRKPFQPFLSRVSSGASVEDMVAELITYCRTRLLWDKLLAEVKKEKPDWYELFLTWL